MNLIEQKIAEGKAKIGVCELDACENKESELLYRVTGKFVCGKCLDDIGDKMKKLGMI